MFSGMLIRDGFEWATVNFNVVPRRELLILYSLRCCRQTNHADVATCASYLGFNRIDDSFNL